MGTEQSTQAAQQSVASVPPISGSAGFTSAQMVSSATSSSSSASSFTSSGSFIITGTGTTESTSNSGLLAIIKGPVVHALASLVFAVPVVLGLTSFFTPTTPAQAIVGTPATSPTQSVTASPTQGTSTKTAAPTSTNVVTPRTSVTPDPIPNPSGTSGSASIPPGGSSTVMFRVDAAHTGYKPEDTKINEGNVGGLHELWKYPIDAGGGEIHASPIVAGGVIYIQSHTGLYAFDASQCRQEAPTNCQPLWRHSWGSFLAGAGSTVAVANGIVYVGAYDTKIYAFDAEKCRQARGECTPRWTSKTGGYVFASPTILNGILYIGSQDHIFYAFDTAQCLQTPTACGPIWSYQTNAGISSSAAADNDRVYVGSLDHNVYAFNLSCRSGCLPVATYHADGPVFATPAVKYGKVYVNSQADPNNPVGQNGVYSLYSVMFAFDATCSGDCQPLWRATSTNGNVASPAVDNGLVYFGQGNGWFYVYDAYGTSCPQQVCQPLWIGHTINAIYGSPLIANGLVFVTSTAKEVLVYKHQKTCIPPPSPCAPLWEDSLPNMSKSSPFVEDGVLYFADDDGYLYAYA